MLVSSLLLLSLIYFIFYLVSFKGWLESENLSSYECGFDLICNARNLFSYRFFLISILFLIFDVEIALMLPIPYFSNIFLMYGFFTFLVILIVGLLYEYNYGMLNWV